MYTHVAIHGLVFGYDPCKRQSNLRKHKLDLLWGADLFDGRQTLSYPSPRNGEDRVVSIGRLEDMVVALVWLEREDAIALISLRRARDAEKRLYHARFCH